MAMKLFVNTSFGDAPHHDWNRPAGKLRTTWTSQIVRDTELTVVNAWAVMLRIGQSGGRYDQQPVTRSSESDSAVFCALQDQLASLDRYAQLTRCLSAVAELLGYCDGL